MAARICGRSMCRVLQQSAITRYHPHSTPLRSFAVYYTKDHEWLNVTGNKAVIGITDHAQKALGEIVYVELPEIGAEVEADEPFGTVESVKAASDVMSPVDGVITKVNNELSSNPSLVNQLPEDEGWMVEMEMTNESQLSALMDKEGYEKFLQTSD